MRRYCAWFTKESGGSANFTSLDTEGKIILFRSRPYTTISLTKSLKNYALFNLLGSCFFFRRNVRCSIVKLSTRKKKPKMSFRTLRRRENIFRVSFTAAGSMALKWKWNNKRSKDGYVSIIIILHWNGKVNSFLRWTLPKLSIISKNCSNKSCWELNYVQKSQ